MPAPGRKSLNIPEETWYRFKKLATEQRRSIQDVAIDALDVYLDSLNPNEITRLGTSADRRERTEFDKYSVTARSFLPAIELALSAKSGGQAEMLRLALQVLKSVQGSPNARLEADSVPGSIGGSGTNGGEGDAEKGAEGAGATQRRRKRAAG